VQNERLPKVAMFKIIGTVTTFQLRLQIAQQRHTCAVTDEQSLRKKKMV
jgi:hypothetical protein